MKTNRVCIVFLSSLFTIIQYSTAMINHVPKDIDDALRQFNATKLEEFFTAKQVLNDIPQASFPEMHDFFLANIRILHHPKMRLAFEQRFKKESYETLKHALSNYRAYAKSLYAALERAHANDQASEILLRAIETEIKYYDLLLATAVYHKEMLVHIPNPKNTSLFSCLSSKIALGIGVTIAGALAYYGYTTYKKEASPVDPKKQL